MVDGLLDKVADAGEFEVIADLAYPLPVAVICRLLGVPIEDEPKFSWASALLGSGAGPVHRLHRRAAGTSRTACRPGCGCATTCATCWSAGARIPPTT